MKNINIKLTGSDYKYLCLLVKQGIDAVKEYDSPVSYCTLVLLNEEYTKLIKKIPKLTKAKSITANISFSLFSILNSYIRLGLSCNIYDEGNIILIKDLFGKIENRIREIQREGILITDIV